MNTEKEKSVIFANHKKIAGVIFGAKFHCPLCGSKVIEKNGNYHCEGGCFNGDIIQTVSKAKGQKFFDSLIDCLEMLGEDTTQAEQAKREYQSMIEGRENNFSFIEKLNNDSVICYVVENQIDAYRIIGCGYDCISYGGGIKNAETLGDKLSNIEDKNFYLIPNRDSKGASETKALIKHSNGKVINIAERFYNDKEETIASIEQAGELKDRLQHTLKPHNVAEFIKKKWDKYIEDFIAGENRKTGFKNFDKINGALYSGLYVICAMPSLGKTTIMHQIADYMAENGQEVLYFSLEMSTGELLAKSYNRELHYIDQDNKLNSLIIRRGGSNQALEQAKEIYKNKVKNYLNIVEGNFNYNISDIEREIKSIIQTTGELPVVFIDYLQLLKPVEGKQKQTTKEVIDDAITQLKQLSRKYNLTIVTISSMNRANYTNRVDYTALKESGGIEYTADVIFGLDFKAIVDCDSTLKEPERRNIVKQAKAEDPRRVTLSVLKQRNGSSGLDYDFLYYAKQDIFIEGGEE